MARVCVHLEVHAGMCAFRHVRMCVSQLAPLRNGIGEEHSNTWRTRAYTHAHVHVNVYEFANRRVYAQYFIYVNQLLIELLIEQCIYMSAPTHNLHQCAHTHPDH